MKKLLLTSFSIITVSAFAQLTVTGGFNATQLGNVLAGTNVNIMNATITGANAQKGTFNFTGTGFPISSGVILSNGNINTAIGPNTQGGAGTDMGQPGHPDLTAIAGVQTYDAVEFMFEFEVQSDQIEFNYVFASEEYNEFVGSNFNDVFAFFISGPGITGWENIALIPNTNVPVAINNVNNGSYWQYYFDNDAGPVNIQFDGFTELLTAKKDSLIPCSVYTLKLIIADAGDGILDAAVFLEANSLIQGNVSASSNTFSANNTALEGCIDASFTFSLDSAQTTNTVIPIGIGGSAVNGVDYSIIDTVVIIPAGQTSATIIINALSDGLPEGNETIELYFTPAPCQPVDTVTLFINDYQTLQYETYPSDISCFGANDGSINFSITGGTAPFTVTLTDSASGLSNSYTTFPITGLSEGTYYIDIIDGYGCPAEDIIAGNLYTGGPVFLPDGNGFSYQTTLPISGMPPGMTLTSVNQIQSVCITMEHSRIGELEILLTAPNGTTMVLKQQPGGAVTNMGEPCAIGPADAGNTDTSPGIGYTYCFTPTPTYGTMVSMANANTYTYTTVCYGTIESDKYLPAGSYTPFQPFSNLLGVPVNGNWTITVTDNIPNNNGWIFDWSISFAADPPDSIAVIAEPNAPAVTYTTVNPTCGLNNGSVNVTVTGDYPPFTYSWSSGQTTQDISGVGAGSYTLTVTDAQSCSNSYPVNLSNTGGSALTAAVQNQLCSGTNTGAVNLTVTGGTSPYTYSWSNGATTEDISSLAPGTYSVTVTDGSSCISSYTATVNAVSVISITGAVTNENCGDQEGSIDLTIIGGTGPFTYSWSNGATTEDITDLTQGAYTVTATDINGCQQNSSFSIINLVGNCIPNCDLSVTTTSQSNEICGNNNGQISINVFTTNSPYAISWNTGSSSGSLTGLDAGTYTVTVTDNVGCSYNQSYTLTNQTGTLAISGTNITNEVCGNGQGAIDITVSGGSQPYSYLWSFGPTTQDISGLNAGTFSVDITDANGCLLSQSFIVQNQSGTLQQTYGNAMDETCGNGDGSIDITITGGQQPYSYSWSNFATTQDLINISAGNYSCIITDAAGCQISTPVYTVNNQSGGLAIANADVDNEICGNNQGEIILTVTGGTSPVTYLWNTGATTSSISNLTSGTYSCTVSDASGCSVYTGNLLLTDDPGTLSVISVSTMNEVCSNSTGIINIEVDGGTGPVSFSWNTGSISEDLFNLSAGIYSCTISDSVGCSTSVNTVINNDPGTLQIDNMIVTDENCGDNTGAVNLMISGQANPVSYSWSNGSTIQDISGLAAGNYSVTVTDNNGCVTLGNTTVNNLTNGFSLSLASLSNEVCGAGNGFIDVSVSGGSTPYSYSWSNGATTEDISSLSSGVYTLTVTDNAGCIITSSSYTVTNNSGTLTIGFSSVLDEVCNANNGSVNIAASGGTSPYTYSWSNGAATEDIFSLNNGTYTVTITDASGCSMNQSYTVNNSPGTLSISSVAVSDEVCNGNNGAVNITVSGGSGIYTYSWSTGATTQDISGLNTGTYTVTINDGSGCSLTGTVYTVGTNPGNFQIGSVSSTDALCSNNGGAISVSYTGAQNPVSYLWSNGATTEDLSNLPAGVYSCAATDGNGCQLNISAVVNNDPGTLTVSATSVIQETCGQGNGAINISVAGGSGSYSTLWSNGATTEDISSLSSGTYTVYVSDGAGCSQNSTITVGGSGGNPSISGFTINDEICGQGNGSASVNVTGGTGPYTYNWAAPNCCTYELLMTGGAPIGWTSATVTVILNGTVYGVFNNTGTTTTQNIPVCTGDTIQLSYSPGGTSQKWYYLYDASGNLVFSDGPFPAGGLQYTGTTNCNAGGNGPTYSGLSAGSYTVTVTDANGCSVTGSATVNNSQGTLAVTNALITDENCGNSAGAINISLTGTVNPVTYSWSNGTNTQDISGVAAGNYTVTVTNGNGCSLSESYTIQNITNGTSITSSVTTDESCGDTTGVIDITVSGTNNPFTYNWSNGATTEDISGLNAGSYSVTVTDATGCALTQSFTVNNVTNGLSASAVSTDESCTGGDGSVDMTVTSAVPYSILWSDGSTTDDITGLSNGIYTYTITDSLGCMLSGSVQINTQSANITITNSNVNDDFCNNNNGDINLTVTSGNPPLTYAWSNGDNTQDIFNLGMGTYTVIITDNLGCSIVDSFTVNNTAFYFVSDTTILDASCSSCADGSINITVTGAGGLTYSWSNGATTQDISGLLPGCYTVTMTSGGGCQLIETYCVGADTSGNDVSEMELNEWNIYPNPSSGNFILSLQQLPAGNVEMEIYSITGQLVYSEQMMQFNLLKKEVNITHLERGVYFLRLTGERFSDKTARIVLMK
ncbi:MAG: choice-of-anchor L domain-containing protein [Bacteroidota bacterium]